MNMMCELVNCRVQQGVVVLEVLVVNDDLAGVRMVEPVHLFATLAAEDQKELFYIVTQAEQLLLNLILIHGSPRGDGGCPHTCRILSMWDVPK